MKIFFFGTGLFGWGQVLGESYLFVAFEFLLGLVASEGALFESELVEFVFEWVN
jgi:hypothetical protein